MDRDNLFITANRALKKMIKEKNNKASVEEVVGLHDMPNGMKVQVAIKVTQTEKRGGSNGGS